MKFDRNKWNEIEDPLLPPSYRSKMLKDLTENNKLIGISYHKLIATLGKPDSKERGLVSYNITIKYTGIDPVYTKELKFIILKDSLVSSFKVVEWKK